MARIQWTPIVAPDIGSEAIRAQQMAGASIQNAFSGIGGLLNDWEGARQRDEMGQLIARQEAFVGQDSALYDAARRDGSLTRGLTYLRPEALAGAVRSFGANLEQDYRGDIAFADNRQDRGFTLSERERGITERTVGLDIARGRERIRTEVAAGRMTEAQAAIEAATLARAAVTAGQVGDAAGAVREGMQDNRGNVRWEREGVTYADGRQDRSWMVEDRNDNRTAQALVDELIQNGGSLQDLEAMQGYQDATPQARMAARALAGQVGGGGFAGPSDGGGGGGGGSGGALNFSGDIGAQQQEVASVFASSQASPAVIAGILGNFEVEGGYGGALGDGGTASGIAQWRGGRREAFRRRNNGLDPHQAPPAAQARHVIWELTTPEGRASAGISEANARAILNARTPGQAAALFDQHFERSDGRHRARRVQAAERIAGSISSARAQGEATDVQAGATIARASDRFGPQARAIVSALNDDTPVLAVVRSLAESDVFRGTDEARLGRLIREVQGRYSRASDGGVLPAAAAAQMLLGSAKPFDPGKDFVRNMAGRSSGVGSTGGLFASATNTVSWTDVDALIGRLIPGEDGRIPLASDARNEENRQGMIQGATAGRQLLAQKQAELQQRLARDAANNNMDNPVTARLSAEVAALEAQWSTFVGSSEEQIRASGIIPETPRRPAPVGRGPAAAPVRRRLPVTPVYGD
jgi:hypothetical protein